MLPNYLFEDVQADDAFLLRPPNRSEELASQRIPNGTAGRPLLDARGSLRRPPGFSFRALWTSVALTVPRTALYVNLLSSPLAFTLALQSTSHHASRLAENELVVTQLAFVFGLQEASAWLMYHVLAAQSRSLSKAQAQSRDAFTENTAGDAHAHKRDRNMPEFLVFAQLYVRCVLQTLLELAPRSLLLVGFSLSTLSLLLSTIFDELQVKSGLFYWTAILAIFSGVANGIILTASKGAISLTPASERRYMRGAHCAVGVLYALLVPLVYQLVSLAGALLPAAHAVMLVKIFEPPFMFWWPSSFTLTGTEPSSSYEASQSSLAPAGADADASAGAAGRESNSEVFTNESLGSNVSRADLVYAAEFDARTAASGQRWGRGREWELASLLLLAFAQGLVLVHLGMYVKLHASQSSILLPTSMHVVAFLVSEYLTNSFLIFFNSDINIREIRIGALIMIAYSVLVLGFLPVVVEQQSLFAVPVTFWVLMGCSWGGVAALRARIRARVAAARLLLSRRTYSYNPYQSQSLGQSSFPSLASRRTYSHSQTYAPEPDENDESEADAWGTGTGSLTSTRSTGASTLNPSSTRAFASSSCFTAARRWGRSLRLGLGLSAEVAAVAFSMLVAPALGGLALDSSGTYRDVCLCSAALALLGAIPFCTPSTWRLPAQRLYPRHFSP